MRNCGLSTHRKSLKFLVLIISLILLCVIPMLSDLFAYSRTHVEVNRQDVQYASVKNTVVTQKIYSEGFLSDFGISFYAPSGQLYGNAEVNITLSQNGYSVTESVKAAKLRTLSHYEKNPETEMEERTRYEMSYTLRKSLLKFFRGDIIVSVTSDNLPAGTDLFCEVSSTLVSGLPSALADNNVLGKPMVLEYNVLRIDAHFWYEIILLIVLVFLMMATSWLLAFKHDWLKKHNIMFLCAFLIIFIVVSIRNPYASFWGEPFSEAAYEFWYKAENMGLVKSMMSLMSGEALAWWERILMWVSNTISPRKFVFMTAQLMELTWIGLVAAMPCLNNYRRFFCDEIRLIISLFLGTSLLFDSAYYFWSCSYWALIFFFLFSLLPMEKLHLGVYRLGLVLSVLLCVSRIYHVLLIPVAVVAVLLLGKKQGRRFTIYCWTVALAATFEGLFSFAAGTNLSADSHFLQNMLDIGLVRMLENTLYYQIQVINSLFSGNTHWQGSGANAIALMLFFFIIAFFIHAIKKQKNEVACILGGLGFVSLGSVAINVYTSGSLAVVSFPRNYASAVNWGENVYQEADLHFSYAYICLIFLLLTILFYLEKSYKNKINKFVQPQHLSYALHMRTSFVCSCVTLVFIIAAAFSAKPRLPYKKITVEWKSVYQATEQDSYFLAINTFYGVAPISLEQDTDEMIYGLDDNNNLYEWHDGMRAYEQNKIYHQADIGAVSESEILPVLSVTARRALTNFDVKYVAVLRNSEGRELARVTQAQTDHRLWLDFLFHEPVMDVYSISFELTDGSIAYIQDGLQVGYLLEEKDRGKI